MTTKQTTLLPEPPPGRKTRWDKGITLATPRDLHIVEWMAHMYACRLDQFRDLLSREAGGPTKNPDGSIADSTLKDQVERYRAAGWIVFDRSVFRGQSWMWVTKKGLALVGLDDLYAPRVPSASRFYHISAINEIRLHWWSSDEEEELDANEWISERRLRAEMLNVKKHPDHDPAAIRLKTGVIPDGVVVSEDWTDAVEVELSPKKPLDTQKKLQGLIHARYVETGTGEEYVFSTIHFFVPNKAMQNHIERAREHLSAKEQERIEITLDEELETPPQ